MIWLRESLYRLSLEQLHAIGTPSSFAAAADALARVRDATPQLGASSVELVYYPVTPCRYIDTRFQGGPLAGTRTYDLAFTGGAFGGSIACDPKAAVGGNEDNIGALAINVAIVGPTAAPGFLGVRPAGGTTTTALVNWWEQGPNVQASNAGVVSTLQSQATAAEIEFFGSPTQFIVDVFGVFAAPTATALDCTNGTETNVVVDTANRDFNLFAAACPTGYAMVSNSCQASGDFTGGNVVLAGQGTFTGDSNCFGYYAGTSSATIYNTPWCCRIPGR